MPTFQTIRIHPELHARLVTESSSSSSSIATTQAAAVVGASDDNTSDKAKATLQSKQLSVIETPQALLSRNPASLRLWDPARQVAQPISSQQVDKLRMEVAHALIDHSTAGKRCRHVHDVVVRRVANKRRRHRGTEWAIAGTNTALDLLDFEQSLITTSSSTDTATATIDPSATLHRRPYLSTGCARLDRWISLPTEYRLISTQINYNIDNDQDSGGGIPFGYVTQISGPPATGKTQLALQIIASSSSSLQYDAITCWYFSSNPAVNTYVDRLNNLLRSHHPDQRHAVLNQTTFVHVADGFSVLQNLARLEEHQQQTPTPTLLVIDSISTSCLTTWEHNNNEWLLQQIASTLKRLARNYLMAVLVTNGVVQNRDIDNNAATASRPNYKPALGRVWRAAADIGVWLEPRDDSGRVHARLERHPTKKCGTTEVVLRIAKTGVQEV